MMRRLALSVAQYTALNGITIALLIYVSWSWLAWHRLEDTPATDWIAVNALTVDDTITGRDPRIVYRRDILKDFAGTFNATVYQYANSEDRTGTVYCQGNGGSDYKAGRDLPPKAASLSWVMNREAMPCQFENGIYKLVITWLIYPDHYPAKMLRVESNFFKVSETEENS